MRTRVIVLAVTAAACSVAAAGDAAVGAENGPILFVGSRAENFHAEIYSVAADGAGRTHLTRNQSADQWPAVSPDGERIAFVSRREGFDSVYVMNAGGSSQPRRVGGPFNTVTAPVWSPSGRALAFTVRTPQMGLFDSSQHYVVDLASGRVRALGSQDICGANGVAFSPDGRFVAYQMGQCRESPAHVRVVRADGGRARGAGGGVIAGWAPRGHRLLLLSSTRKANIWNLATVDPNGRRRWVLRGVPASAAAWSPNGRLIAFVRTGRRPGVYVIRPGGRRPRRLLALANARSIAWSPDGAWLALTAAQARRDLGLATYLVGSNGHGLRRVADSRSLPIWSRDSRRLAFIGMDEAAHVVSPLASSDLPVTDTAVDAKLLQIAWAGDRLVFASRSPDSRHLFAVEPDGSGLHQITPDAAPAGRISPDGSRVAFARDGDIWTARLDGSDQRQLTSAAARHAQAPGSVQDAQPAWSPDGRRLAFVRGGGGSGDIFAGDIFLVDSSGGAAQQVTNVKNDGVSASGPAWSPDGAWIAFTGAGLFAVRPDGSGLHRIVSTANLAGNREPAWSPDGLKLALGGSAIAVVNVDGSGYQPLTGPGRAREAQPAWSPDGTKIVFVRSADPGGLWDETDSDLWTVNLDGSGEARLTDGRWPDVLPAWMPLRP